MKIENFKTWLLERGLSERPVSDYISRCKRVERDLGVNLDSSEIINLLDSDEEYDEIHINGNRKNGLASIKSAVGSYYLFTQSQETTNKAEETILVKKVSTENSPNDKDDKGAFSEITVPLEEIKKRFFSRLKTQDRIYPDLELMYWPRLFNNMYPWYTELLKKEIEEKISCLIFKGGVIERIQLKEIQAISFVLTEGKYEVLVITKNNEKLPLYSVDKPMLLKLSDDPLREVTLDHISSLYSVMSNLKEELATLTNLFQDYKSIVTPKEYQEKLRDTDIREAIKGKISFSEEEIRQNIIAIHDNVEIELMLASDNSKKGKNC